MKFLYSTTNNRNDIDVDSDSVTETMRRESIEQFQVFKEYYSSAYNQDHSANEIIFLENQSETSKYIDENFDAILFDCDGVLYRGTDPIPGAPEALKSLMNNQNNKKKILFVTNNAGSNRIQLRDKLSSILSCSSDNDSDELKLTEEQMLPSSYSAAQYIRKALSFEEKDLETIRKINVHVIGTQGLCEEIRKLGCYVTGGPSTDKASMSREELASYSFSVEENQEQIIGEGSGTVDAVVVGLDNEFNYRKLCIANVLLQRNPNALLVATNEDAFDLVGVDSRQLPGNGALVKAIEHCSQRKAINVGKPSHILATLIQECYSLNPERTLFVGDRLDTDIKFGKDGKMKSALVMTGCTTARKLIDTFEEDESSHEEPLPDIIFPHMGMMGKM